VLVAVVVQHMELVEQAAAAVMVVVVWLELVLIFLEVAVEAGGQVLLIKTVELELLTQSLGLHYIIVVVVVVLAAMAQLGVVGLVLVGVEQAMFAKELVEMLQQIAAVAAVVGLLHIVVAQTVARVAQEVLVL
jgi:hypothetical protein